MTRYPWYVISRAALRRLVLMRREKIAAWRPRLARKSLLVLLCVGNFIGVKARQLKLDQHSRHTLECYGVSTPVRTAPEKRIVGSDLYRDFCKADLFYTTTVVRACFWGTNTLFDSVELSPRCDSVEHKRETACTSASLHWKQEDSGSVLHMQHY